MARKEKTWGGWRIEYTRWEKIGIVADLICLTIFGIGIVSGLDQLAGIGLVGLLILMVVYIVASILGGFDK